MSLWWKEKTNSYKLSSDRHMCTVAHTFMNTINHLKQK